MEASKPPSSEEVLFAPLIVCLLCLVVYKQLLGLDLHSLLQAVIQAVLICLGVFILITWTIFAFKGQWDDTYKKRTKTLTHLIAGIIIGLFIYDSVFFPVNFHNPWYLLHASITLLILLYYDHKMHTRIFRHNQESKDKKECIHWQQEEISNLLRQDPDRLNTQDLLKIKSKLQPHYYLPESVKPYLNGLDTKRQEINYHIQLKLQQEQLNKIIQEKKLALQELEEIRRQKKNETTTAEERKRELKNELEDQDKTVFIKKDLNTDEIDALLKLKYSQSNEYDLLEHKNITVLIKPILNHSNTHTFLVWSIIQLLKSSFENITNIQEHETRDADITFQYKRKTYAIEIETGTLLKQKKQLTEKVAYLNKKYSNRWFFAVTNKNTQHTYRKYGLATRRIQVAKTLQKMLKNATRQNRMAHINTRR